MAATNTAAFTSTGAETRQTPAGAKGQTADEQAFVDLRCFRQVQGAAQEVGGALTRQCEGEEAYSDGATHDECQRRVPVAEQV
jgi:hypothetical protein